MTTQPNQDDVAAFMKEQLVEIFAYIANALVEHNATPRSMFHHDLDVRAIGKILALVQQSNRQLLDEVEAAGPKKWGPDNNGTEGSIMWSQVLGHDKAVEAWHQAIHAIKERRGL